MLQESLHTKDKLARLTNVSNLCIMCNLHPETITHLLSNCQYASQIWKQMSSFGIASLPSTNNVVNCIINNWNNMSPSHLINIFTISWKIWDQRNCFVFQNKSPQIQEDISHISFKKWKNKNAKAYSWSPPKTNL